MIKFTIYLPPKTKKKHSQIIFKKSGNKKIPILIPSSQYIQYEKDCKYFMPKVETIDYPVNIEAIYYMPTKRRVDKTNLESALLDILVEHKVLKDDNSNIVVSTDGSRVLYDKDNPRTEVTITPIKVGG